MVIDHNPRETQMKINKEKLDALCALDDDALWREIRGIAAAYGLSLPERTPPHSELEKMRSAAKDGARLNLADAMKILNKQRRGNK